MVRFTEIEIRDGYIYALETDLMSGDVARIKLRLECGNEEYYYDGNMTNCMIKALWNLRTVYHRRGKLEKEEVIYWG